MAPFLSNAQEQAILVSIQEKKDTIKEYVASFLKTKEFTLMLPNDSKMLEEITESISDFSELLSSQASEEAHSHAYSAFINNISKIIVKTPSTHKENTDSLSPKNIRNFLNDASEKLVGTSLFENENPLNFLPKDSKKLEKMKESLDLLHDAFSQLKQKQQLIEEDSLPLILKEGLEAFESDPKIPKNASVFLKAVEEKIAVNPSSHQDSLTKEIVKNYINTALKGDIEENIYPSSYEKVVDFLVKHNEKAKEIAEDKNASFEKIKTYQQDQEVRKNLITLLLEYPDHIFKNPDDSLDEKFTRLGRLEELRDKSREKNLQTRDLSLEKLLPSQQDLLQEIKDTEKAIRDIFKPRLAQFTNFQTDLSKAYTEYKDSEKQLNPLKIARENSSFVTKFFDSLFEKVKEFTKDYFPRASSVLFSQIPTDYQQMEKKVSDAKAAYDNASKTTSAFFSKFENILSEEDKKACVPSSIEPKDELDKVSVEYAALNKKTELILKKINEEPVRSQYSLLNKNKDQLPNIPENEGLKSMVKKIEKRRQEQEKTPTKISR